MGIARTFKGGVHPHEVGNGKSVSYTHLDVYKRQFHELIAARLGEAACFAPAHLSGLRAASAAALALHRVQEAVDYLSLEPLYLRAPQAERERAAREAKAREGK